ncbi:MAG TPA: hypothetical protein VH442_19980 [Micromonosporaceae bacterium]
MSDGQSRVVPRPSAKPGRWSSFVAETTTPGRPTRAMSEAGNPKHRVRVEYNQHVLLVHLSDEDGAGWTTFAVDRATREWSVAQRDSQLDAASSAVDALYDEERRSARDEEAV